MRILYIIESFGPGGKERRLSQLIEAFSKDDGFEVEVIVTAEIFHYKNVLESGVRINKIDKSLWLGKKSGIRQFYKICKRFKPDIIHTWGGLISIFAIPSSILCKVPIIDGQVTATTVVPLWEKWFFYKIPFLFSRFVVPNTKAAINVYGIPRKKVVCIYNGFDFDRIKNLKSRVEIIKELSINSKYIIGMVASFVPLKDHSTFIKAGIELLKVGKDITFICIGKGEFNDYLKLIPVEYKNRFKFLPPTAEVENIMNICDIGVLSSFREGLPNVVLEFMALGKPVVSTNVGGVPELISDGKDGFVFPVGNVVSLFNILKRLLDDKNLRLQIGANAFKKVKYVFTNEKMILNYINLYKKSIK